LYYKQDKLIVSLDTFDIDRTRDPNITIHKSISECKLSCYICTCTIIL